MLKAYDRKDRSPFARSIWTIENVSLAVFAQLVVGFRNRWPCIDGNQTKPDTHTQACRVDVSQVPIERNLQFGDSKERAVVGSRVKGLQWDEGGFQRFAHREPWKSWTNEVSSVSCPGGMPIRIARGMTGFLQQKGMRYQVQPEDKNQMEKTF
jgi:hypothetical protein